MIRLLPYYSLLCLLCLFWLGGLCAGADASAASLTRKEALRIALERNLVVRSGLLQYQAAAAAVNEAEGLYDPRLQLLVDTATSRDAQNLSPVLTTEFSTTRLNFSLLQRLPSGAELSAGINQRRDDNLQATTRAIFEEVSLSRTDLADAEALYDSAITGYLRASGRLLDQEGILLLNAGEETPYFVAGDIN